MEDESRNVTNIRFPDYIFTKVEPQHMDVSDKHCDGKKTDSSRFVHFRKWLKTNLLLLVTVCGVLFGLLLGKLQLLLIIV